MTDLLKDYDIQHAIDVINEECPEFFWSKTIFTRPSQIKGASERLQEALSNVFSFQRVVIPKKVGTSRRARSDDLNATITATPYRVIADEIECCYLNNMTMKKAAREMGVPFNAIRHWTKEDPRLNAAYEKMYRRRDYDGAMRSYQRKKRLTHENHV